MGPRKDSDSGACAAPDEHFHESQSRYMKVHTVVALVFPLNNGTNGNSRVWCKDGVCVTSQSSVSRSLLCAWHSSSAVSVPCQQYSQAEIRIHPALCSSPRRALRRCPHNLLPTPNWITSLVFCAGLAPAVPHLPS